MRSLGMIEKFAILMILAFCFCSKISKCQRDSYDTTILYRICNGARHFKTLSPYGDAVYDVIDDLLRHTETNDFNYYSSSQRDGVSAYGHAACNGEISQLACGLCLSDVHCKLLDYCGNSIGAQIQVRDCRLRYENYPFIE